MSMDSIQVDPCPHLLVESGPDGKGVGAWVVQDKYRFLHQYLRAARAALARWPERIYIDPFCATGRVQVRGEDFTRPGGAVEAWRALVGTPGQFTRMLLGDLEGSRAGACAERLTALGANATAFSGPAIETVPRMVAEVPRNALCIAFLDPYNFELLDFGMLRTLAQRKVDLIIHFSTMDVARNADMELDPSRARFDAAAPGWRGQPWAATCNKASLPVAVEGYWQSLVRGLGFEHSAARPLITNDRGRGIYKLAFFARHNLPIRLWGDIAKDRNGALF